MCPISGVIRPGRLLPKSRVMHPDHPWSVTLTSLFFPSGSLVVERTTAIPTPHARVPHELGLSLLVTGVWLGNHLFRSIFTVGVPRPEASTPCLDVAPSSAPLIREPNETPPCPAEPPSGPSLRCPTMTLVNARVRGPVGTQVPQSRAANLLSKETMASPYRPTWLHVTGCVQCTEVTFSCSHFKQCTRVLIKRLGLNVACASQVYVKSFKSVPSCTVPSLATFSCTLHLPFRVLSIHLSQKSLLSFINNRRYDLSPLISLYF